MKVLMIASWYFPKDAPVMTAGVFHYEQSMALQKYCDTALYYPYDTTLPTDFSKKEERGLLTYRRKPAKSPIPKLSSLLHKRQIMGDLKRICAEFQPDVIHAHCGIPAGRIAVQFGKKYGYPVVITEHCPMEQLPVENEAFRRKLHYAYNGSSANVCVSRDSMERLQPHFADCGFRVIYNGILSPENVPMEDTVYARPGAVNCCIVAAFYSLDIKGYQFLLPAIARLKQEGFPVVLHICGAGDYFEHYVNLAKELDIEDCVIFYGNCSKAKVYSIVSQMDFNISASLFECSGVSVEEALLLGKPMLVTRSGGANSLVNDDVAIVVDKGSVHALVDGIKQMAKRLPDFDAAAIRAYAEENFEIDHVSRQYMALYESLKRNP